MDKRKGTEGIKRKDAENAEGIKRKGAEDAEGLMWIKKYADLCMSYLGVFA